jgi:hypothetical protein
VRLSAEQEAERKLLDAPPQLPFFGVDFGADGGSVVHVIDSLIGMAKAIGAMPVPTRWNYIPATPEAAPPSTPDADGWIPLTLDAPDLKAGEYDWKGHFSWSSADEIDVSLRDENLERFVREGGYFYRPAKRAAPPSTPSAPTELVPEEGRVYLLVRPSGKEVFAKKTAGGWGFGCIESAGPFPAKRAAACDGNRALRDRTIIRPATEAELRGEA